jgi:hypothetical protein
VLSEIAIVLDQDEFAFETLEHADRLGLIDIVVLEKCPLFERVQHVSRFREIRERVRQRASKVLAGFRSTAG